MTAGKKCCEDEGAQCDDEGAVDEDNGSAEDDFSTWATVTREDSRATQDAAQVLLNRLGPAQGLRGDVTRIY